MRRRGSGSGGGVGGNHGAGIGMAMALCVLLTGAAQATGPEVKQAQLEGGASFRLVMIPPGASSGDGIRVLRYEPLGAEAPGWGVYESETLRVEWPLGATSARLMAARLDRVFRETWSGLGLSPHPKMVLQLHPVEVWPSVIVLESTWPRWAEAGEVPVALPMLEEGAALSESVQGVGFPLEMMFLLGHELTEYLLVTRPRGTVLMDTEGPVGEEASYHTRWFREGFATAVAVAMCDELGLAHAFTREKGRAALERVGARLFFWTQGQELDAEGNREYYDAAYELVSRMMEAEGEAGMAEFIRAFDRFEYLDGRGLGDLTLEHFGRRPREFLDRPEADGGGDRGDGAVRRAD